jgi:peroxiredoxin
MITKALSISAILLTLICCLEKKALPLETSANNTNSKPGPKPTIFSNYLLDTARAYTDFNSMNKYRDSIETAFWDFKDSINKSNPKEELSYQLDSLSVLNQNLYTYQIFKFLESTDLKQEHLMLLTFNPDFSTVITPEDRIRAYNRFPKDVKQSRLGLEIFDKLQVALTRDIGTSLDFLRDYKVSQKDGSLIAINALLDSKYEKYLLVFGASWCGPCRFENQLLKRRLSSIDTTNIKIIGISVDESREKWLKMVDKDKCPWVMLKDTGGLEKGLAKALKVKELPTNILIDGELKVIDRQTNIEIVLKSIMISKINGEQIEK